MSSLRIITLGTVAFWHGGEDITAQIPLKAQALVIYLAAEQASLNRTVVADMFWRDYDIHRARANLRMALGALRRLIPDHVLISRNHVSLNGKVMIDALEFQKELQASQDKPEALEKLLPQYRGDFLEGFFIDDAGDFEQWRNQAANSLRMQQIQAYEKLINHLKIAKKYEAALEAALQVFALDNEREASHRLLMELYALSGNRHAALSQYESLRQTLEELYNISPSIETTRLYQEIRQGESYTSPAPSRKLPPLPEYPNPFIGRHYALNALATILKNARLVTLLGIGGIGKTRLAIALGQELEERFADAVAFIQFDGTDPYLRAAEVLGLNLALVDSIREHLIQSIVEKQMLLILDQVKPISQNLEFIETILSKAPHIRLLVTGREPLNLYGEYRYPVPPLTVPVSDEFESLGDALQYDSINLFARRVQEVMPDFQLNETNIMLVADICRRLDGIPFALELAAAQTAVRSLEKLGDLRLQHLSAPYRQNEAENTLFEILEWSYSSLNPEEQQLYRQLGLFAASWSLETLEAMFAKDLSQALQALLMRGLVWRQDKQDNRFSFLAPVREHARWHLQEAGEEAASRENYIHYYLNFALKSLEGWQGIEQLEWLERLDAEYSNLQAVLAFSQKEAIWHETHAQIIGALGWYWYVRCHHHEALHWLENAIKFKDEISERAYAGIIAAGGHAAFLRGDSKQALAWHNEAQEIYHALGDKENEAFMLFCLTAHVDDFQQRFHYAEKALEIARPLQMDWLMPNILVNLSEAYRMRGDFAQARQMMQEGIALSKKVGNEVVRAYHLLNLCDVLISTGHYSLARMYLKQGLALSEKIGDNMLLAEAYGLTTDCELALNQIKQAEIWAERSAEVSQSLQNTADCAWALMRKSRVASAKMQPLVAQRLLSEALLLWEDQPLETGRDYDLWLTLCDEIFTTLVAKGEYQIAARLEASIEKSRSESEVLRRPIFVEAFNQATAQLHSQISFPASPFLDNFELIVTCSNILAGFEEAPSANIGVFLQNENCKV